MGAKKELSRLVRYLSGETLMVRSLDWVVRPRLERLSLRLPRGARVLDIGSKNSHYRSYFSHCIFQTVDIERRHQPDIVADLHSLSAVVAEGTIDAIVCTEVLEHVRSPQVAIQQMRSSLKPGGTLIASTPFLVPYHPDPTDFWRITAEGWAHLTRGFTDVEIIWHGNQIMSLWYLAGMGYGMPLRLLDAAVFTAFKGMPGAGVYLGLVCEARAAK